jgi:protein-tyrosine phosphatase
MVDIHCHILPGVDDGAATLEQAVSMVRIAAAAGTTDIVATPHASPRYSFDPELIGLKISELRQATNNLVRIHSGCDFHLSATNIQDALAYPTKYVINHRTYLLVEFSDFLIPPTTDEIFDRMRAVGIVPVITHPERNGRLHDRIDQIRAWVAGDCLVQVTAQSFLGRFGKSAKTFADALMKNSLIHFVASDGHDPKDRPPVLDEAYRYIADTYGASRAAALFVTNPRAALTGEPLEPLESTPMKRKWYERLKNRF